VARAVPRPVRAFVPEACRHAGEGRRNGQPASTRTTQLSDRRRDEMSLDQVERISI
jgi:hypothetical protein